MNEERLSTRERARKAAFDIFKNGEKPTADRVRRALGGGGGQNALLDGVKDFWEDLATMAATPAVPAELWQATQAVWQVANAQADEQVRQATTAHAAEIAQYQQQLTAAQAQNDTLQHQLSALQGRCDTLVAELTTAQASVRNQEATIDALKRDVNHREDVIASLESTLRSERAAAKKRADDDAQVINEQRTVLAVSEQKNARLDTSLANALASQQQLDIRLADQRQEFAAQRERADAQRQQLADEKQHLVEENQQLAIASARIEERATALAAEVAQFTETLEEKATEVQRLAHDKQTCQKARDALTIELTKAQSRLETADGSIRSLEDRLKQVQTDHETRLAEVLERLSGWVDVERKS